MTDAAGMSLSVFPDKKDRWVLPVWVKDGLLWDLCREAKNKALGKMVEAAFLYKKCAFEHFLYEKI